MKKITLILMMLLFVTFGFAQQVVVQDFEDSETFTFEGFEGLASASIEEAPMGTNGKSLKLESVNTGNPWQGAFAVQSETALKLSDDKTVSIDVYSTQAFNLLLKVEDGGPNSAASQSYTTPNEWQTLTFTMDEALDDTAVADGIYKKVVFFPNWKSDDTGFIDPPQDFAIYVDNITSTPGEITEEPEPMGPTSNAPTPPARDASDVISIFSKAYDNVVVSDFNPGWGQKGQVNTEFDPTGEGENFVLAYTNFNYQGTELSEAQDASDMEYLNVDIWVAEGVDRMVKVTPVNEGPSEFLVEVPLTPGSWNSVSLPKASFEGMTWDAVFQLKFDGQFNSDGSANTDDTFDIFLDNIYFSKGEASESLAPSVAAPNPTEDEANVLSLFSNAYTDVVVDTWRTSWSQGELEEIQIEGIDTKRYFNLDYVGIETTGDNLVDATDMDYFHIDVWTANATQYKIKLVDFGADGAFGGGDDTEHELVFDEPALQEWVSLKISLSDFTGLQNRDNLAQYIIAAQPTGSAELYIDNIYFSKETLSSIAFDASQISIYPNPAATYFNIESKVDLDNVRVYNMLGKVMMDIASPSKRVDTSNLSSGVYLVQLSSGKQQLTKRLVIK